MQQHRLPAEAAPAQAGAWYRQPVLWLGAAILLASLAGCVWMIVLGARHADAPLEGTLPHTLLDMPMHGNAQPRTDERPRPRVGAAEAAAGPPERRP